MSVIELGVVDAAAVCKALPPCPLVHVESDGERIWAGVQADGWLGMQFAGGAEAGCCDVPFDDLAAQLKTGEDTGKAIKATPSPVAVLLDNGDVRLESVDAGVFLPALQIPKMDVSYRADDPILARLANGRTHLRLYYYQGDTWMAANTLHQVFAWRVLEGTGHLPEMFWRLGPIDRIAQPDPQRAFGLWSPADGQATNIGWSGKWGIITAWGSWFVQYPQRPLIDQDMAILAESHIEPPRINLSLSRDLLGGLDPSNCLRMRDGLLTSLDVCVWADILDKEVQADVFADMFLEVLPFLPGDTFDGYAQGGTLFLRGDHWRYRSTSCVSDSSQAKALYDESE